MTLAYLQSFPYCVEWHHYELAPRTSEGAADQHLARMELLQFPFTFRKPLRMCFFEYSRPGKKSMCDLICTNNKEMSGSTLHLSINLKSPLADTRDPVPFSPPLHF